VDTGRAAGAGANQNAYPGIGLTSDQQLILLGSSSISWTEMVSAFQYLSNNDSGLTATFLDGGGSTSLYLRDPSSGNLDALVGSTRYVGNSLVVSAVAVPEPGSLLLVVAGFLGVLIFLRTAKGV
jgi:hypothetical protein